MQTYETPRFDIAHFDLYRVTDPSELDELGLEAALKDGVAVIEWPSRAGLVSQSTSPCCLKKRTVPTGGQ